MSTAKRSPVAARPAASKSGNLFTVGTSRKVADAGIARTKREAIEKAKRLALPPAPKKVTIRHEKFDVVLSHQGKLDALLASLLDANNKAAVDPLVDVVRRHVPNMSSREAGIIRREFLKVFERPATRRIGDRGSRASRLAVTDPVLTTQEAADLVGVSRPFMVARIDAGDIPLHTQAGTQRRVLRSEVLAWRDRARQAQRAALKELAQHIEDEYDED
jgi:excisionase family DNA binding protein